MNSSAGNLTATVSAAVQKHANTPGGLMPLLHDIQRGLGYIPKDCVGAIATAMGLSRAEVHGVISFYHDFHSSKQGRITIHLCRAEACQAMGARALESHVKERLGIDFGETTPDGAVTLQPVYCLGNCACAPSIRMGDDIHARVSEKRFDELLAGLGAW